MAYDRPYQYLYNAKWARSAKQFLKDNPLCVYCLQVGKTTAATICDHRIPHEGDIELFNDPDNRQPLCKHCHDSIKAKEEARGYAVGCDAEGMPLDKKHGWNKGE